MHIPLRRSAEPRAIAQTPVLHGRLKSSARPLLGAAILAILIASGRLDLRAISRLHAGLHLGLLFGITLVALAANSLRWACLARVALPEVGLNDAFLVGLSSNVLAVISPAGTGADIARVLYLIKSHRTAASHAAGISLIDRSLGIYHLIGVSAAIGWLCMPAGSPFLGLRQVFTVVSVLLSLLMIGCLSRPLRQRAIQRVGPRWRDRLTVLESSPSWRLVAAAFVCSLVGALANLLLPLMGLLALGYSLQSSQSYFASAIIVLINSVAPTPGGLGVGEAAASALFSASSMGAPAMLVVRTVGILCALGMGALAGIHRSPVLNNTTGEE